MSKVLSQTVEALQRLLDRRDATIAQQSARIAALESELATLRASVVAALSSAGPADDRFAAEAAARHRADCHDPGCACRDV